jgi:anti-anti-sigma factor
VDRQTSIEVTRKGDIGLIRIAGRLATGADDDYIDEIAQEIKGLGCRRLIADLRELTSIGSAGIGLLVDLHASVVRRTPGSDSGSLVVAGPSRRVLEVLKLTGLTRIMPVTEDVEAALKLCVAVSEKVRTAGSSLE